MVFQKTLDYGFIGYQVPQIPRATRSARKRSSVRKQIDDNSMCAFDLLATVAGNLLLEKESSPSSSNTTVKRELVGTILPLKVEDSLKDNSEKVARAPDSLNEDHSGLASVVTSSDCSEKVDDLKYVKKKTLPGSFANKVEMSSEYVVNDEKKEQLKVEAPNTENMCISSAHNMYSSDFMLESNVKLPLCDKNITSDDVKLVVRDDDENSSRCTKFGTGIKAFRPSPRVGDRRIRKLLASKYWKVTSKSKEMTSYKADSEMKPAYEYECRKNCYKRYRSQRDYPFKKRRLYRCGSLSNSDCGINDKVNGGSGISAHVVGQTTPLQTRDSHVKLRIKSFKVPELFIEIPENATVGNLKRTVLDAVTAALGGGLRVGVLLQGKKIRDDNRTLQQTGISHNDMLEALGFSLEPNSSQVPSSLQHEASLLSCDTPPKQLKRYPEPSSPRELCSAIHQKTVEDVLMSDPPTLLNFMESDHDSAPSPPDNDSKAIIAASDMNAEALNMGPLTKSSRSDSSQRRIRRPFSVTEVEALVQAVEKLGTGRWRDVKLRAFDNAKHRTYVDLKDKWKTLVHTARISPQQRRGEPVPQELLDRVLSAHAYWSQQQVKQQFKHHSETRLLL